MNESIKHLEEKIAHLERHVTEQDKAMLEFADELAAIRGELKVWRARAEARSAGDGGDGGGLERDERPPHY